MMGEFTVIKGGSTITLKFREAQKFSNTEGTLTAKHLQGEWRRKPTSSTLTYQTQSGH